MNPEENKHNKAISYIFIGVIVILLLVLAYGMYLYVQQYNQKTGPATSPIVSEDVSNEEVPDVETLRAGIRGNIAMSMVHTNDEQPINLYNYDPNAPDEAFRQLTGNQAHLGFEFVNIESAYHLAQNEDQFDGDPLDIFFTNFANKETERIPTEGEVSERNLSWSENNNLLAYTAQETRLEDYVENIKSENWHVTIYDPATEEKVRIDNAFYGTWIDGESVLLFARKDGLHLYDITTGTSSRALVAEWEVSAQDMFEVSDDSQFVAWAIPGLNQVRLYQRESVDEFALTERYRIGEQGKNYYWPVFSPDSMYFAVQSIDAGEGLDQADRTNFRVDIHSVIRPETLMSQSLDSFYSDQAFIDDWLN